MELAEAVARTAARVVSAGNGGIFVAVCDLYIYPKGSKSGGVKLLGVMQRSRRTRGKGYLCDGRTWRAANSQIRAQGARKTNGEENIDVGEHKACRVIGSGIQSEQWGELCSSTEVY